MKTVSAKTAREFLGIVLSAAQREPVTIEQNGVPMAVLVSPEDYLILEAIEAAFVKEHADDALPMSIEDDDRVLYSSLVN